MNYMIWIIIYLIFATIFSQEFKIVNKNAKNISALTSIINTFYEFVVDKKKDEFIRKLVISLIILVGVVLIKI